MKLGRSIYIYPEGHKATFMGLTVTGLAMVLTAGRVLTVRPDRVKTCRERSDRGTKRGKRGQVVRSTIKKKEVAGG